MSFLFQLYAFFWLRFTVLSNFIFLLDLQYTGIDSLSLFSILLHAHVLEIIHSSSKSHFLSDSHCVVSENIHTPHGGQRKFRGEWGGGRFQKEAISEGVGTFLQRFFLGVLSKIGELFSN